MKLHSHNIHCFVSNSHGGGSGYDYMLYHMHEDDDDPRHGHAAIITAQPPKPVDTAFVMDGTHLTGTEGSRAGLCVDCYQRGYDDAEEAQVLIVERWNRRDHQMICSVCLQEYWRHPQYPLEPWLNLLCDGSLVKL